MSKRRLLVAIVLGLSCAGAYWLGSSYGNRETEPQYHFINGLSVEFSSLRIGEVWEGEDFSCELPVQNVTGGPVKVQHFITTCGCLGIEPGSVVLPAKQTKVLRLKMDLTHRAEWEIGQQERPVAVEVLPVIPGARPPEKG